MKKGLAVFGGTFDPIHNGHLACAKLAATILEVPVRLVPCFIPPHRDEPSSTPDDRLAMLNLAVEAMPELQVDSRELERAGKSFTVDTLRSYREELGGDAPLYFLLGLDSFLTLPEWYQWRELGGLCHLVVLARPGYEFEAPPELANWGDSRVQTPAEFEGPAGGLCFIDTIQCDVSSTRVRQRLKANQGVNQLLPEAVQTYIENHHLYAE